MLSPLALASVDFTTDDDCTTTGSISSKEDIEPFLPLLDISITTDSEEEEYIPKRNSPKRHKKSYSDCGISSPQPNLTYTHSVPIISPDPRNIITRRIAIIGGGGAGSIIATLLSNLSEEARFYGLRFVITIFERNSDVINGSTFETSAVLHAGGREYPMDPDTAADCQASGALFEFMLPGLYDTSTPIMYFPRADSDLTLRTQQDAHKAARQKRKKRGLPTTPKALLSQSDLPPEKVQKAFGPDFSGGIKSTKDKFMKNDERNARIKKCIYESRYITIENNSCVSGVTKNEDGTFKVIYSKSAEISPESECSTSEIDFRHKIFDHVIITAWDENQRISGASEAASASSDFSGFIIEDRVMAFCDISRVPLLQKTPLFTLPGGEMFMPLDEKTALIYRCIEGGSYPERGKTGIDPKDVNIHGEKILHEFKESFRDEGSSESRFDKMTLLGAKLHKAVRREGPLSERRYESPEITSEGYIVATPPKATFIGSLALQTIEQLLRQLPDSFSAFKERWIQEILEIVPSNEQLFTRKPLPKAFTINPRELTPKEILTEKVNIFKSFTLTDSGGDLFRNYQSKLEDCEALCRCNSAPHGAPAYEDFEPIGSSEKSASFRIMRSSSDPHSQCTPDYHKETTATWFDLSTSGKQRLALPIAMVFPLESNPLKHLFNSFEIANKSFDITNFEIGLGTELDSGP